MSVRFVLGRPGAGKTRLCLREIAENLKGTPPLYYLVPEQFSLQSEKLLTHDVPAFLRAQALSFNRLAYQLFARLGGLSGKTVDEPGRSMLLRKVMYECADALRFYGRSADKQGFIDSLSRTLTELNQYNVSPEDLRLRAVGSDENLAAKLTDLALILEKYRAAVSGRYLVADETLTLLSRRLETAEPLRGSLFWVDGFTGFTPQERRVLGHILQTADRVTVTLTLRRDADDDMLYETTRETRRILTELAHSLKVPVEDTVYLEGDHRHADEMRFFAARFNPYHKSDDFWPWPVQAIEVVPAADRYAEAREAARRIGVLVSESGYRFRDIAILCGHRAAYEKPLRNIFSRCGIPLFVDTKTDIFSHPLTELIRAAIEIIVRDWPYESVFRFLKTRLTSLATDEIDILENYVLARGVKGYLWRYPFTEPVESARLRVLAALAPFTDKLYHDKKETIRVFSRRVFDMLYALNVTDTLTEWHAERSAAGDHETARTHQQIWPKITEIFDKLVEILGDEKVTVKEFGRILDAGLTQADLGLIPPSVDQVFLGDIGRSRFPDIKALLVVGANEGKLPPPSETAGLFTNDERVLLANSALELAPDLAQRANDDLLSLYCALCQPRESLAFLYANGEPGGGALRPAKVISRLKDLFPALRETCAPDVAEYEPVAGTVLPSVKALSPQTAGRLYGPTVVTAASRMEKFTECPFAYFVTYNLHARERKIYQVQSSDLGVVFHEVLAMFSRQMADESLDWRALDRAEITRRVENCVEAAVPETGHALHSSERNRYMIRRVKRICVTSVWALAEHIRRGSFLPAGVELDFSAGSPVTTLEVRLNRQRKLILTGRIDRVDILRADGVCYVKIIDYKSGRTRFDLSEVLLGTQLQLMLYMNALLKNGRALFGEDQIALEARPGGVFYFNIDDPILSADDELEEEQREALLLKCFRMSGLALAEPEALTGMDAGLLSDGGESLIIPVTVNKNGAFGKLSSVADLETFERLGRVVEEKIKEIGLKMTEGVIEPDPCRNKNYNVCDYCRYSAICGHSIPQ